MPDVLSYYELLERLGTGGMGTVWRARDSRSGAIVALKVLHPHLAADADYIRRFQREARIASSIESPFIIRVLDIGRAGDSNFLVMDYVAGKTLAQHIQEAGRLPVEESVRIASAVASALAAAHVKGIIHRDVSPQNVMLGDDGSIRLTDFGVARDLGATAMTATSMLLGKPQYIAPELVTGESDADIRSDIYALGIVIYQMLAGFVPFNAQTPYAVMMMQAHNAPPPLDRVRDDVPPALLAVLDRCLAKRPAGRYQTPDDLFVGLASLALNKPSAKAARGARQWPFRLWIAGLTLGMAATLVIAVVLLSAPSEVSESGGAALMSNRLAFAFDDYATHSIHTFDPETEATAEISEGASRLPPRGLMDAPAPTTFRLSPTGRHIAHQYRHGQGYSLNLTDISDAEALKPVDLVDALADFGWSPDGNWLAYQVTSAGSSSLFAVHVEKFEPLGPGFLGFKPAEPPLLIHAQSTAGDFGWSPDSKRLTYSAVNGNRHQLMVTEVDSASPQIVAEADEYIRPIAWSPDGEHIAYSISGEQGLKVIALGLGAEPVSIDTGISHLNHFEAPGYRSLAGTQLWSSTGNFLIFRRLVPGNSDLYLAQSDGSNAELLFADEVIDYSWSPSEDKFLVELQSRTGASLWLSGSVMGMLEIATDLGTDRSNFFAWSMDGQKIAVGINRGQNHELRLYHSDGSFESTLATGVGYLTQLSWSFDSEWVGFTADRGSERSLTAINISSKLTVELSKDVRNFSWSKNAALISYVSGAGDNQTLYVAEPGGPSVRLGSGPWISMEWSGE